MANRGRPSKVEVSTDELVEKTSKGTPLTLQEVQQLASERCYCWVDKKTGEVHVAEPKKMSLMGWQKVEQRALAKLRAALAKYGINSLDDVFGPAVHSPAKMVRCGNNNANAFCPEDLR